MAGLLSIFMIAKRPSNMQSVSQIRTRSNSYTEADVVDQNWPGHNIMTQGQPVLAPTLQGQAPGRTTTRVQITAHWYECRLQITGMSADNCSLV